MSGFLRLAILAALAVWAWRYLVRSRGPHERASLSFSDGSAIVLEPGSAEFERLASVARSAL
ncbi:MAG: hypothetical protein M3Q59_06815 [Actinomycetota bacterium]|nr:hypothetical protein [Actinomycetota bacterium]MDQ3122229.1 hypothetical protein [Actinomycetota bacterium]